ncbi:MAG: hypothetical protein WB630_12475 [Candidatus Acidiferrales bacterium]
MELREVVDKYLATAGGYGKRVPIASLGLSHAEAERAFDVLDEDYLISRFFHFHIGDGERFQINGFPQTDILIDAEIREIL